MDAGVRELRLINRTRERAEELAKAFTPSDGRKIVVGNWDERANALEGASLRSDHKANKEVYGQELTAPQILREGKVKSTPAGQKLVDLLLVL